MLPARALVWRPVAQVGAVGEPKSKRVRQGSVCEAGRVAVAAVLAREVLAPLRGFWPRK